MHNLVQRGSAINQQSLLDDTEDLQGEVPLLCDRINKLQPELDAIKYELSATRNDLNACIEEWIGPALSSWWQASVGRSVTWFCITWGGEQALEGVTATDLSTHSTCACFLTQPALARTCSP
ncbi:hypothetical protein MAPG_05321 [Magnaporthiopsis poae ATCC 64411]|uniref:Uncharacterized protein n=1 Tax=Magnaporthiopsis poae (strain ATCC 64411 / 73-15) TaxID=644358 RepID=A0A0C4DZ33_MAGP6|nr:hypothetical protein MAPG_05321 [Magnaporthiopsis poae ATCC 64411]